MVGMHLIMVDAALFMVQVTGAEEKKKGRITIEWIQC